MYTAPTHTIHPLPLSPHTLRTFSHVLPLTLPLITPIRHRKEKENIFLFPLTPPASPFFTVPHVWTPSGSSLGFTEQLTRHMAPLSISSGPYHTDFQPSLCFESLPLLSSSSLHPGRALRSFSVGNPVAYSDSRVSEKHG